MATSMSNLRPIVVSQLRSALLLRVLPTVSQCQPIRFKNNTHRPKAPHVAKDKSKWTSRVKGKLIVKDTITREHPNWVSRKPVDDVWIRARYPPQMYSFEECITRHQEYAHPSMLDNMEGLVYMDMDLDMTTKKKTKFMKYVNGTLLLPHRFPQNEEKKTIVFCKTAEDQQKAKDLGATFVGGQELVQQVLEDTITRDMYDFAMCTPDILVELLPIRGVLKDKFPHKNRGNLSPDIPQMMELFTEGVTYLSNKETDAVSKLQIPFGNLNMATDELQENFMVLIQAVSKQRAIELGPIIKKASIIAPPSPERFLVRIQDYVAETKPKVKAQVKQEEEGDDEEEKESLSSN